MYNAYTPVAWISSIGSFIFVVVLFFMLSSGVLFLSHEIISNTLRCYYNFKSGVHIFIQYVCVCVCVRARMRAPLGTIMQCSAFYAVEKCMAWTFSLTKYYAKHSFNNRIIRGVLIFSIFVFVSGHWLKMALNHTVY